MKQKGIAPIFIIVLAAALAVGGYLIYSQQAKPVPKLQTVQTTPAPSSSPDEIANPDPDLIGDNWKIYTNKDSNISLKYPANAKVKTGTTHSMLSFNPSDAIIIETPYLNVENQGYIIDIAIKENPQNLPAQTVINNYLSEVEKTCSQPGCGLPKTVRNTLKEYTNSLIKGYIFHIGAETDSVMVVQAKNNKIYIFRVSNGNGYATEQGIQVFNQILSTFKFLP